MMRDKPDNENMEGEAARTATKERFLKMVAGAGIAAAVIFGVLWGMSAVPAGSAAKVDDFYIVEDEVEAYTAEYRARNGLQDDADFAAALLQQSLNPGTFRQNGINQLALNALIERRAKELGVAVDEDDVQEQVDAMKEQVAMGDEDTWSSTLDQYGTNEERVRAQFRTNLAEQGIYEKAVPIPEASDEQVVQHVVSNKASTTDVHSYRILFTGKDSWSRAEKCMEEIDAAGADFDAELFSGIALSHSDDDGVNNDGGSYGWCAATNTNSDYLDELAKLKDGEVSGPVTLDDQNATAIIYRDQSYTYPPVGKATDIDLEKLPESLKAFLQDETSSVLWRADCSAYLANMLGQAKITYYPLPDNASCNVDMTKASTTSSGQLSEAADERESGVNE